LAYERFCHNWPCCRGPQKVDPLMVPTTITHTMVSGDDVDDPAIIHVDPSFMISFVDDVICMVMKERINDGGNDDLRRINIAVAEVQGGSSDGRRKLSASFNKTL
jgi:hypothetical protein